MDLTKQPILVSISMPVVVILQYGLTPILQEFTLIITALGLAVWATFAVQVFFRANRQLQPAIRPVFVFLGLGVWPLIVAASMASETLNDAAAANVFETSAALLWMGSIALLTGTAAVALERAEKGRVRAIAVAGTSIQLFIPMFCAVHVCARLGRLDKSAIWWK